MREEKLRYGNIFTYASLQFSGNIEEYFARHSNKLVVFLVMPRLKNKKNLIRIYEKGKLMKEENVSLSQNIFLYYLLWFIRYIQILAKHFKRDESVIAISFHPISLFCMNVQKMFRNIQFVYWIGDYFPPSTLGIRIYEAIKKYYHDRIAYTCYLGDGINTILNKKVLDTSRHKTIMWGVKPKKLDRKPSSKSFRILFVGVVKESQGLEYIFDFLKNHKECYLNIIGICDDILFKKYTKIIKNYNIEKQIYFPNKFFSDSDVDVISKKCHVGIAMYDTDPQNPTYYTDPGKVKAYIEMGLPVIMSDVSAVSPYIKKFKAGEVITQDKNAIQNAITKIKNNYYAYEIGVKKFCEYFYFESYYEQKFKFLEKLK
jgi:glycosyltransferase involved in cell wall biosynthesis